MTNGESLLHELTALADSWERELAVSMAGRPLLPVGKFEVGLLREAVSALRGAAEPPAEHEPMCATNSVLGGLPCTCRTVRTTTEPT